MSSSEDRSEIAFFDVETTVPTRSGQGFAILEFGAILVCCRKLIELQSYSTLVRPSDLSLISSLSVRCNGISRNAVISAPTFNDIAERVYDILHGRIWAGHNILRFDCARIREAFADIGRPAPEPKGTIDSLALLTERFGRRAGDMKMATLATYFGLGKQTHRSLDDVRMNLEVLKYCATVLFLVMCMGLFSYACVRLLLFPAIPFSHSQLSSNVYLLGSVYESSLPDIFTTNSWVPPNALTRSRSNGKSSPVGASNSNIPAYDNGPVSSSTSRIMVENHSISCPFAQSRGVEVSNPVQSNSSRPDPFNMAPLSAEIAIESHQSDVNMEEKSIPESPDVSSTPATNLPNGSSVPFLVLDEVSISFIRASHVPFYRGSLRMKLLHKDITLQLQCSRLKVRFGISAKFVDPAGRPRLNFVVDAPPNLYKLLDSCDDIARKSSLNSGSSSEWRPVVTRKNGFFSFPTVRLHIPAAVCGNIAIYATEIYQKENSGSEKRLVFSTFDASELSTLFTPGTFVDAFFSLDPYDYQQLAGIKLVAKKLIIHSD
ncbi:Uncharacterized protein L484_008585 [Morus notabilis]|uniref:Exonuclease domain-containing protein n=1 Tax=Morus notabilis TaxID=981085 RepID=W9QUA6_9ROSA|nr:Uncharacterized protein L484_008585 [Morus notabilis]